jgi:hypothetical protein
MKNCLGLFLGLGILISIGSCDCMPLCVKHQWMYRIQLHGFTKVELDTVVVKKYLKPTGYTHFIDSTIYRELIPIIDIATNDTSYTINLMTNDTTDYEVFIPHNGRSYFVDDMQFTTETCKACGKKYKITQLKTYRINGTPAQTNWEEIKIEK